MSITVQFAKTFFFTVAATLLTFPLIPVRADAAEATGAGDGSIRGYEYEGPYAQFGVALGQIDFDQNDIDNNASGGFTMTGGYRFLPWLAGEGNFTYLGGGAVETGSRDIGNGSFFAFTVGPKFYPLGALEIKEIPDVIQPYATIGIGGGQFHIEHSSFDRSGFIARFILGVDFWATDHMGFFVEGGGHATDQNHVDGVGVFTVGGQYRF